MDVIDAVLRRVLDDKGWSLNPEVRGAAVRRRAAPGEVGLREIGTDLRHSRLGERVVHDAGPLAHEIQQHRLLRRRERRCANALGLNGSSIPTRAEHEVRHTEAQDGLTALGATERSQAILSYRVADLVLGPGQDGRVIHPEGIRASALSAAQQAMLLDLVREWSGIMNDTFAEPRMAEIRTNLPQTYFAWSGPTTNGSAAYFRIQGPTLVIEYAPQNSVDHIHTIYRDPTNDYGAKFTRQ